ncbi:hypothetical protein E2C01_063342 [Portunus trituberculatus]|uniref:Uncharacterized protein n=1 Tax=Portunus trituberculatus TaxID=210409 RepID=A0A5B7HGT3_PORTR|nr:hypothetical protein [Portunus trituberculatus]
MGVSQAEVTRGRGKLRCLESSKLVLPPGEVRGGEAAVPPLHPFPSAEASPLLPHYSHSSTAAPLHPCSSYVISSLSSAASY